MSISVISKTSNSITVSASYPSYVPPSTKTMNVSGGCTITWRWSASGSTSSKNVSSSISGITIRWKWTWSGSSWTANGWDPLNAPSTKSYSDVNGYSGTLSLQGVSPGSRPSPPPNGSYPVGTGGHVDASTGTASYSGTVSKTTYSWVENGWGHNAPSTYFYDDGTYSGTLNLTSVSEGSRPSPPSGSPTSSGSTATKTTSGTEFYSGTVSTGPSGAVITRTKMYANGAYWGDGSASNNFSYAFTGLTPGLNYELSVQWFSSGDTLVGSNSVSDTTLDVTPSLPTVIARGDASLTLSWGSVMGATNYQLDYKPSVNSVWNTVTTSSTSTSLFGLAYGLGYDFRARAFVDGVWRSYSPVSNATVNPKTPSITGDYQAGVVTITVGGMAGTSFDSVVVERLDSSGSFVDSKPIFSNGGSITWAISSSIIANYKFRAYSTKSGVNSISYSNTVSFVRPANFVFQFSTISKGSDIKIDRRDWNNLAAKINAFRTYKELPTYGFTTVTTANPDITAVLFNQLVSGANGLSSYMTNNVMPSTKSKGDDFYASYLNNIVTSINSIS